MKPRFVNLTVEIYGPNDYYSPHTYGGITQALCNQIINNVDKLFTSDHVNRVVCIVTEEL